jgi:hypothetical protein
MARAANLFVDYSTRSDVLVTVEYTAFDGFEYRQQVIQAMKPSTVVNKLFGSATSSPISGST